MRGTAAAKSSSSIAQRSEQQQRARTSCILNLCVWMNDDAMYGVYDVCVVDGDEPMPAAGHK